MDGPIAHVDQEVIQSIVWYLLPINDCLIFVVQLSKDTFNQFYLHSRQTWGPYSKSSELPPSLFNATRRKQSPQLNYFFLHTPQVKSISNNENKQYSHSSESNIHDKLHQVPQPSLLISKMITLSLGTDITKEFLGVVVNCLQSVSKNSRHFFLVLTNPANWLSYEKTLEIGVWYLLVTLTFHNAYKHSEFSLPGRSK
jgi:hypothetical protein